MNSRSLTLFGIGAVSMFSGMTLVANPALTEYKWQSAGGDYSGSFDDSAHWDKGAVPGALSKAVFNRDASYTLAFPLGVYDCLATFNFTTANNRSNTINGKGSVFKQPETQTDNYHSESFILASDRGHFFNLETYKVDSSKRFKFPRTELTGVSVTVTNESNSLNAHFNEGVFKFYGVDGSTCMPRLTLFHGAKQESCIYFHENSELIAPDIEYRGNGANTAVVFDGGTHSVNGQLKMPSDNFTSALKANATFEVKNTAKVAANTAKIGDRVGVKIDNVTQYVPSTNRVFNIVARDGGRLSFSGMFEQNLGGTLNLDVLNEGVFSGAKVHIGGGENCSNRVRVVDAEATFGDFRTGAYTRGTVAVTNSVFGIGEQWYMYNTDATFASSDVTAANILVGVKPTDGPASASLSITNSNVILTGGANIVGDGAAGVMHLQDGANVSIRRLFEIGKNAGSEGALVLDKGSSFNAEMTIANEVAFNVGREGEGRIEMNGGRFRMASANPAVYNYYALYLGLGAGSHGVCEMNDGEMIVDWSGGLIVGSGGNAEFYMKGGYLECHQIRLCYMGSSAPTGLFHQTGGEVYVTSERADVGVNIADSAGRKARMVLDGGVFRSHRVRGWTGASVKGGGGWAAFSANGGKIVATCASNGFVETFDEAKLGEKGLVLDSSQYAVTIPQDFSDKDDAQGRGTLVLCGSGTKTLTGTNSTQSRLVLNGGKTVFGTASSIPANHYSHAVVTNGAILSFAGANPGGTFKSLKLGDDVTFGYLEIDETDKLSLDAAPEFGRAALVLTGASGETGSYVLMESKGAVPEETAKRWSKMLVSSGHLDGAKYVFSVSYDEDEDKTSFVMTVAADVPPANTAVWSGPGDDLADSANWDSSVAPDSSYNVLFSNPDAPAAAQLASGLVFGTLAFTADKDFTISGAGEIAFADSSYAKILVEKGTQTIDSDVSIFREIEIDVERGAKLVASGAISYGGIRKTGEGTLDLLSRNNFFMKGLVLEDGRLRVPAFSVLGGDAENANYGFVQKGGTIEFGVDNSDPGVWTKSITVDTEVLNEAVVWKTDKDVTMNAPTVLSGCPIKRGAGTLTFLSDENAVISVGGFGTMTNDKTTDPLNTYDFDDVNGLPPSLSDKYVDFMVVEGELVLRGKKEDGSSSFTLKSHLQIGMNTKDGVAQPGIVIDNAFVNAQQTSRHFMLGAAINTNCSFVTEPYLYITNNGRLNVDTLMVGRYSTGGGITNRVYVDNSTLYNSYTLHPNRFLHPDSRGVLVFTNNAECLTPFVQFEGLADLNFHSSVFAAGTGAPYALSRVEVRNSATGNMRFMDGSKAYISNLKIESNANPPFTISFAGESEWIPSFSGDYKAVWMRTDRCSIETEEENGMVVSPGNGCEWTIAKAITGEGGVMKKGEGTLRFVTQEIIDAATLQTNKIVEANAAIKSPFTLDFEKAMNIREGRVFVEEGAARTNAVFTGCGTLSAANIASPVIEVEVGDDYATEETLTLDSFTHTGTLVFDLGRTPENPLPRPFAPIVVAKYTGTAPDVSKMKLVGTGLDQASSSFIAANGNITATVDFGMLIILK